MSVPVSKLSGGQPQEVLPLGSDGYPFGSSSSSTYLLSRGWTFDVAVVPTVTAGSYSANDIQGALLTFANVSRATGEGVILNSVRLAYKSDVNPAPKLVLLYADPSSTTKTDNAAYSLAAADAFKVIETLDGFTRMDHGTPNTFKLDNIGLIFQPVARDIYGLVIDTAGVTLGSTSDLEVRIRGAGL